MIQIVNLEFPEIKSLKENNVKVFVTSQPGGHWQTPVTGWQFPLFWQRQVFVQLEPCLPGGQGVSHLIIRR